MKNSIYISIALMFAVAISEAQITVTANTTSIGRYDVYELTIQHPMSYTNNWEDVTVAAVFSGPQTINISGFFYDSTVWKVRFAPPQTGSWNYAITFTTPSNTYTASGSFTCVASSTKGFLQQHPTNPFRLIFPDGTLFNGIGIGDCIRDGDTTGTPHDNWGFDGEFRPVGQEAGWDTTLDVYMNAYGANGAGFNLFRWSIDNCAFNLYQSIHTNGSGNTYLIREGMWGDSLVRSLRQNNIRLWTTFFGFNPPFPNFTGNNSVEEAAIERYISYVVARYGAYTDIWELYNEATTPDHWIYEVVPYLNSIDPYNRLVTTSWERPNHPDIDINAPHWYETESEFQSDQRSWDEITNKKGPNKPIVFGEQGNGVQNWDSTSARRMRLRSWTAFFAEGMFIFWNSSWAKDYFSGAANLYLGPQERGYIRVLQNYTALADTSIRQLTITPSNTTQVKAYGLKGTNQVFGYFHHYSSHSTNITTTFNVNVPVSGFISWIDPETGAVVSTASISSGMQTITSPSFMIDLAMVISPAAVTGITEQNNEQSAINIYPNPANTEININLPSNNNFETEIINTLGEVILKTKNQNTIDVSNLTKGIYLIRAKQANKFYVLKFIKT